MRPAKGIEMTTTNLIELECFVYQLKAGMLAQIAGELVIINAIKKADHGMYIINYSPEPTPSWKETMYLGTYENVKFYQFITW